MKEVMSNDRAKHNILPLTKFGIMQITRQRVRPEMTIITDEKCPACKGTGEIKPSVLFTDDLEQSLIKIIEKVKTRKLLLRVHPFVAAYLKEGWWPIYRTWNRKYGISLKVEGIPSYTILEFHFSDRQENEIDLA
jgi:ribonuclease G